MNVSPCMVCEQRFVGCHAECGVYKAWDAERAKQRDMKRQADSADHRISAYKRDTPARKKFLRRKR